MKIKLLTLASAVCFLSYSCDSGGILEDDETEIAASLSVPASGDTITFTNLEDDGAEAVGSLTFNGTTSVNVGGVNFVYSVTGENLFNIDVTEVSSNTLTAALNTTLGAPSFLNSRIREILDRGDEPFTDAEIVELVQILNGGGGNVEVSSSDPGQILFPLNSQYRMRITSTVGDQRLGSVGGVYLREGNSAEVLFRSPSAEELNQFRFLTSNFQIPFVSTTVTDIEVFERGTFEFNLVNVDFGSD